MKDRKRQMILVVTCNGRSKIYCEKSFGPTDFLHSWTNSIQRITVDLNNQSFKNIRFAYGYKRKFQDKSWRQTRRWAMSACRKDEVTNLHNSPSSIKLLICNCSKLQQLRWAHKTKCCFQERRLENECLYSNLSSPWHQLPISCNLTNISSSNRKSIKQRCKEEEHYDHWRQQQQ